MKEEQRLVFTYDFNIKGYYLLGPYLFFPFIVLSAFSMMAPHRGFVAYAALALIEIVVLVLVSIWDHQPGQGRPTTVIIKNGRVTLYRLWAYQRFPLADVVWVEEPIAPSFLHMFFKPLSLVFYMQGGKQYTFGVDPRMPKYTELLGVLRSAVETKAGGIGR